MNSTNITTADIVFFTYYYGTFILIACVNVTGNILVITTVGRYEKLRQPMNYLIASLAVSDLFIVIIYPVYNVAHIKIYYIQNALGKPTV